MIVAYCKKKKPNIQAKKKKPKKLMLRIISPYYYVSNSSPFTDINDQNKWYSPLKTVIL